MYIEQFEIWLRNEGKNEKTITAYLHTVKLLAGWYEGSNGKEFNPEEITPLELHNWKSYQQTVMKFKPATINKNIAAVKIYWTFLVSNKGFQVDPTVKVKMKRSSQLSLSPRWLTRQEQSKLLQTVLRVKNLWKQSRDLAIIHTMLNGGLRVSEVAGLDVQDIDFKRGVITIQNGKGGKFRVVPVNKDLSIALSSWLVKRGEAEEGALFSSERGGRLTDRGIQH